MISDVMSHLGIVSKLALKYWSMLPSYATMYISLEDMVQDAVMRVVEVQHLYDPERGKESTFVWRVVEMHCLGIVQRHQRACRFNTPVDLEAVIPHTDMRLLDTIAVNDNQLEYLTSKKAVERVLTDASDGLAEVLSQLFYDDEERAKLTPLYAQEIADLIKRYGVSIGEFRCVMAGA